MTGEQARAAIQEAERVIDQYGMTMPLYLLEEIVEILSQIEWFCKGFFAGKESK